MSEANSGQEKGQKGPDQKIKVTEFAGAIERFRKRRF
jgi:hypothetical protein